MNDIKRFLAAVALAGAALSFASAAHADVRGEAAYEAGINEFADWSEEESGGILTSEDAASTRLITHGFMSR